jgi:hypothetical protein
MRPRAARWAVWFSAMADVSAVRRRMLDMACVWCRMRTCGTSDVPQRVMTSDLWLWNQRARKGRRLKANDVVSGFKAEMITSGPTKSSSS